MLLAEILVSLNIQCKLIIEIQAMRLLANDNFLFAFLRLSKLPWPLAELELVQRIGTTYIHYNIQQIYK